MRKLIVIICALLLSGCVIFSSSGNDTMAELTDFDAKVTANNSWRTNIGHGLSGHYLQLAPVVVGDVVFAANYNGYLTAVNTKTGKKLWKVDVHQHPTSGLAANKDLLFVGTSKGYLLALSQQDGQLVWWKDLACEILAIPTVMNDKLLVKSENGYLAAYAIKDSKLLWEHSSDEPSLILRGSSRPQVAQGVVVAGFASGELKAFSLAEGRQLWSRLIAKAHGGSAIERMVDIDVEPQIVGDVVYVASYQGNIAAVNLQSGNVLWRRKLSSYSGLVVAGSRVYVSDADGRLLALNRNSGAIIWQQKGLAKRGLTAPVMMKNTIVVADAEGFLHWLSKKDGNFIGRDQVARSAIYAAPVLVGDAVYVVTANGYLAKYTL